MIALFGLIILVIIHAPYVKSTEPVCTGGSYVCTMDHDCFYHCRQGCPFTSCIRYCEGCSQQVGRCWCL